jgi:hypothetical protein
MLRTQVRIEYTMTRMTRGEVISAFIHGGKGGDAEAADRLLQKLEEDKSAYSQSFEAMKHGALVTPYLRHGCVYDTRTAKQAMGFSKHMRKHWTCPRCMKKFIVTIDELRQHERVAVGPAGQQLGEPRHERPADPAHPAPAAGMLGRRVSAALRLLKGDGQDPHPPAHCRRHRPAGARGAHHGRRLGHGR